MPSAAHEGTPVIGADAVTPREWQRIRRHAVPGWMIAECTEARERGDWRAACEAGAVDVVFTSPGPAGELLAGFAPDLLRWHLPRAPGGTTMIDPGRAYVLAPDGPVDADTVVLVVRTPPSVEHAQRLTLDAVRAGDLDGEVVFPLAPHLWDARRAGELRAAANGSAHRLPRFVPAVDPLPAAARGIGDDPPAPAERIRQVSGQPEAWAMAGWLVVRDESGTSSRRDVHQLRGVDPLVAARELRRVAAQFGRRCWALWSRQDRREGVRLEVDGDRVRAVESDLGWGRRKRFQTGLCLRPDLLDVPVDVDLVRAGLVSPADLHPLVRAALFPTPVSTLPVAAAPARAAGLAEADRIRVRCGGVWHWIGIRTGRLEPHDHRPEEQWREQALRVFGGTAAGCFAVTRAWRDGGRLPRRLHAHRRELRLRLHHGGTRVLHALLDAGLDPHLRDGARRTLLHDLGRYDLSVLPRLLAEGLDVDARDADHNTPLHLAVYRRWPAGMIIALADAGADPHAVNGERLSPLDLLKGVEDQDGLAPAIAHLRGRP